MKICANFLNNSFEKTFGYFWIETKQLDQLYDPRNQGKNVQPLLDTVTRKTFQHQVTKLCQCKYTFKDVSVWLLLMSPLKLPTSAENLNQLFDQQFWKKNFGYFLIEKKQSSARFSWDSGNVALSEVRLNSAHFTLIGYYGSLCHS